MRLCEVDGCERKHYGQGLCSPHWMRKRRTGRLDLITPEERFWQKVEKGDGCWLWRGGDNTTGYGRAYVGGVGTVYPHRYTYELANGPIPEGMQIDHLCRTRNCVRPDHLEAVTPRENTLRGESPTAVAHREGRCTKGHPKEDVPGWCPPCRRDYERARRRKAAA